MVKLAGRLIGLLLVIGLVSCNGGGKSKGGDLSLKTEDQKTFYAVGLMFGGKLKELNLSEEEMNFMVLGIKDAAKGAKPQVEMKDYHMKVQELFKKRISASTGVNKKAGADFMAKFVKNEGAKKTASGLAYKVIKEGTGTPPKPEDSVEVHYHGTLIDGTVFDSSKDRGKTVNFPLNRVIKGWTEGLQLIKPGGLVKLVIPSELAYGEPGAPPRIPGGSTLVFEVELFKVTKADASKAGGPKAPKGGHKKGDGHGH
ncbi:MAG: FKBP-type peptidyl-prolyl cis-trans isomerase [Bacteriovoracaceae bacterium]|jgi:FKBP-type peptidyl-prolyl cis-trans isomerase FkpA|nr:FKBP-type peptidyl-prolyl cis-trans isomerase [Bacteriovoracaceae bacterium]